MLGREPGEARNVVPIRSDRTVAVMTDHLFRFRAVRVQRRLEHMHPEHDYRVVRSGGPFRWHVQRVAESPVSAGRQARSAETTR